MTITLVLLYGLLVEPNSMTSLHHESVMGFKSPTACEAAGMRKLGQQVDKKKYKGYVCRVYKKPE